MVDAILLGSSGMLPLSNRPLTSLYVACDQDKILVDCGEGTQIAAQRLGINLFNVSTILLTHLHADHILGLPGLLLTLMNDDRVKPLTIMGPVGTKKCLQALFSSITSLKFPVFIIELTAEEDFLELTSLRVEYFKVKHDCTCYGYSFVLTRPGYFNLEKAVTSGLPESVWGILQNGIELEWDGAVYTRQDLMGEDRKGVRITYVTDTLPVDVIQKHSRQADLLILEGMYSDKCSKRSNKKHLTMQDAAEIARDSEARLLCLTHFSPSCRNPYSTLPSLRKIFKNTVCGYAGFHVKLDVNGDAQFDNDVKRLYTGEKVLSSILSGVSNFIPVKSNQFFDIGDEVIVCEKCNNSKLSKMRLRATVTDVIVMSDNLKAVIIRPQLFGDV